MQTDCQPSLHRARLDIVGMKLKSSHRVCRILQTMTLSVTYFMCSVSTQLVCCGRPQQTSSQICPAGQPV